MFEVFKRAVVGSMLIALGACTTINLADVQNMKVTDDAFKAGLHKEYLALATMEGDETDWADMEFFGMRAQTAGGGGSVGPQAIGDRMLPEDKVGVLTAARSRLVGAFNAGGAARYPAQAARAQAMFDCWMQEQEENFQPEDIEACKAAFFAALKEIEKVPMAKPKPAPKPKPKAKPKPKPMKLPGPFTVLFDFDNSSITPVSQLVVDLIVVEAKGSHPKMINLAGHTDLAGKNVYNDVLSKKRVDAVAQALIAGGIRASQIGTAIFGEDKPSQKTADGKRSAKNRRVEVTFAN